MCTDASTLARMPTSYKFTYICINCALIIVKSQLASSSATKIYAVSSSLEVLELPERIRTSESKTSHRNVNEKVTQWKAGLKDDEIQSEPHANFKS